MIPIALLRTGSQIAFDAVSGLPGLVITALLLASLGWMVAQRADHKRRADHARNSPSTSGGLAWFTSRD